MVDYIATYKLFLFYKDYVCSIVHMDFSGPHQCKNYVIDIESLKHLEIGFQPYHLVVDCCKQFALIKFKDFVNRNRIQAVKTGENQAETVVLPSKLTEVCI